jgi:hypothetical protein
MGDLGYVAQVLGRFYAPLAYGIKHPRLMNVDGYPYPNATNTKVEPVKMLPDEVFAWDSVFDITGKALAARKGIVVVDTDIPLTELDRISYKTAIDRTKNSGMPQSNMSNSVLYAGKPFRFFPYEVRFFPFEFDCVELYIQPHAHLEREGDGKGLYAASIQLKFFVRDAHGKLAVAVSRTIRQDYLKHVSDTILPGAIVVPYQPIDVMLCCNTALDPNRQNELLVELDTPDKLRMRAELHNPDLRGIKVPDNRRVWLFFEQIAGFLGPRLEGDDTIDRLFDMRRRVR